MFLEKIPSNDTADYHLQLIPDSPNIDTENVTMSFKIVSGQHAQSAGMILRFIDDKHYFVLMADSDSKQALFVQKHSRVSNMQL